MVTYVATLECGCWCINGEPVWKTTSLGPTCTVVVPMPQVPQYVKDAYCKRHGLPLGTLDSGEK